MGTSWINARAIYLERSTTATEPQSRAWVTKQFHISMGILLAWRLLLGEALKTQYSYSCHVTVRIQAYLQLPIMLMFMQVGGFVLALGFSPPLEHYLCSCKSIKHLWGNAETKLPLYWGRSHPSWLIFRPWGSGISYRCNNQTLEWKTTWINLRLRRFSQESTKIVTVVTCYNPLVTRSNSLTDLFICTWCTNDFNFSSE